jgi:hypothetical protein
MTWMSHCVYINGFPLLKMSSLFTGLSQKRAQGRMRMPDTTGGKGRGGEGAESERGESERGQESQPELLYERRRLVDGRAHEHRHHTHDTCQGIADIPLAAKKQTVIGTVPNVASAITKDPGGI